MGWILLGIPFAIIVIVVLLSLYERYKLMKDTKHFESGDRIRVGYHDSHCGILIRWNNRHFGYIRGNEKEITFRKWSEFGFNISCYERKKRERIDKLMASTSEYMKTNKLYMKPMNRAEKIDNLI